MWNQSLADDIAESFKRLEVPEAVGMHEDRDSRNSIRNALRTPEDRRRERQRMMSDPTKHAKEIQRKRNYRMDANIEIWIQSAKNICVGRELDPAAWREVLLDPSNCDEVSARDDFIVFLKRCRNVPDSKIARMLDVSVNYVWMVLSGRPQK